MKTTIKTGLKIKASIKAGGFGNNHCRGGLKVKSTIKAGGFGNNHTRRALAVKTGLKAGEGIFKANHTLRLARI